jgi:hypothetical protein
MAASTAGVAMGGFLGELNAHGTELGLVVSAGLAGAAVSAVAAAMKIAYDILLWRAFRGIKPPEERL